MIGGVKFGEGDKFDDYLHSFDDLGLILTKTELPMPSPKFIRVSVPGMDGDLDLSDYFGRIRYENRKINMTFAVSEAYRSRYSTGTRIATLFHGKKVRIIFDDDPDHYYEGRITMEKLEVKGKHHKITLVADCDPYKTDVIPSHAPWKWDTFSFVTGVIRDTSNIKVDGRLTYTLIGSPKPVALTVYTESSGIVVKKGKTSVTLERGLNTIYDIEILDGENSLVFEGNGIVSIQYAGGYL